MSILRSSPYSLAYGTTIAAKVRAYNARGWGAYSTASTTAGTIETIP